MATNLTYRIKLLSESNVVLVEADGFESEIFVPSIANGRITFVNVIPNRRCCQWDVSAATKSAGVTLKPAMKRELSTFTGIDVSRLGRFAAGTDNENSENTTTLMGGRKMMGSSQRERPPPGINTNMAGTSAAENSTLPSPDLARRAPPPLRGDLFVENALFNSPQRHRFDPFFNSPIIRTPKKGRHPTLASKGNNSPLSDNNNISRLSDYTSQFRMVSSTPLMKMPKKVTYTESPHKWHNKVLTPKVTYSRKGNHVVHKHDNSMDMSTKHCRPSYLANPTVGPKPTHIVELKKRRLKVDDKVKIPSKVLKKQQQQSQQNNKLPPSSSNTERARSCFKRTGQSTMSAFELLTNANRQRCMAEKLNQQFREGCINKACSTNSKYRLLASVPCLQQDDQVKEMTISEFQIPNEGGNCSPTKQNPMVSTVKTITADGDASYSAPDRIQCTFAVPKNTELPKNVIQSKQRSKLDTNQKFVCAKTKK